MLEHVRAHASVLARRSVASLTRHVDPVLLTEFAERPETLDAQTRQWIERKLKECEICGEAYARLREVEQSLAPMSMPVVSQRWKRLREWLAATILHPVPALAYLLLLALLAPFVLMRNTGNGGAGAPPLATAPVVVVTGESTARGEQGGGAGAEPVVLRLPSDPSGALVVLLSTSLVESDLRGGKLPLQVELRRAGTLVWSKRIGAEDLQYQEGRAELPLVLRGEALRAGNDYELDIRAVLPGDPLDGQALFRRRVVMEERR
jgi:hypothetical protein